MQDLKCNKSRRLQAPNEKTDAFRLLYSRGGGTDDLPGHLLNNLSNECGTLAQVSFGA